ncbi:MAG TPA: hypothetical protein VL092_10665 [Chitinophagaceae bacterium]|nr:hypothetical protein [Chitinophagaceae bacterium]
MRNLLIGLILGIGFAALLGYLKYPELKKAIYDEAFALGKTEGTKTGKAEGITEGLAQGVAQQELKEKAARDSMAVVIAQKEAQKAARKAPVEPRPAIQNWRVLGGNIAEPILDSDSAR